MEKIAKCKSLIATYHEENMAFGGPYVLEFDTEDGKYNIKIEQSINRIIMLKSIEDVSVYDLHAIFTRVERLLMLFDGRFFTLSELILCDSEETNEEMLASHAIHFMKGRLSYFQSADFCNYKCDGLINFDDVLNAKLFARWEGLLDELDIVHQMYLYSVSDSKMPVDLKCAFLIELAEPLVEIVKQNTDLFSELNPGKRGTSLKMCLDALIKQYGTDIFAIEISSAYDEFLSVLVDSRVRIMHIKKKQEKIYCNGSESILYILKMSLLYRKVLFEMLHIEQQYYKDKILKSVTILDKWNNVLDKLLQKLYDTQRN